MPLGSVYGKERVLGVARGDDDEPAHGGFARVPDRMRGATRNEDETASSHRYLAITQQERPSPSAT